MPRGSTPSREARRATAISSWRARLRYGDPGLDLAAARRPEAAVGFRRPKITNIPEANKFLTRKYRPGWEI